MECVALGISGHPPANDSFQFISYFSTILEISLLICLSFGGLFSRPHLNTELLAALLFLLLFVSPSIFVTSRPRSPSLSLSLPLQTLLIYFASQRLCFWLVTTPRHSPLKHTME